MIKRFVTLLMVFCFSFTIIGCGGIVQVPKSSNEKIKFARVVDEGSIGGVCTGLAYFTGTPTWCWRAGFVTVVLLGGAGILAYVVLWSFMPKYSSTPPDFYQRTE